ncbi:cohesin domain-containing protein [Candidatus Dojkabacteria bacterium]|jgi:hypothetical protein|nr:cohesin domain-containing protein [Candidatus Dojkabacteria bacterium]
MIDPTAKKILRVIGLTLGAPFLSIFFVHIFAVFGVFILASYPIWWLVFPKFTDGIFGRITSRIRKKKDGGDENIYNQKPTKTISTLVVDMLFLILIIGFSMGVVYGEYRIITKVKSKEAEIPATFVIPDSKQYKIGEIFPVDLDISNPGKVINVVQADIYFDSELAEISDVSLDNSFAKVFVQKEINNEKGFMRLTGGLPTPGFTEAKGHFAKVYFQAKSAGLLQISFLPTSQVLANDGKGTNILKEFPKFSFVIKPETISPTEKEIQMKLFDEAVLGVSTNKDYLIFFEPSEKVLGVSDSELSATTKSKKLDVLELIKNVDKYTLWMFKL